MGLLLELLDPVVPGVVLGAEDCAPVTPPLDDALLVLCACASVAPASPSAVSSANDLSLSMMYTSLMLSTLRGESPACTEPQQVYPPRGPRRETATRGLPDSGGFV